MTQLGVGLVGCGFWGTTVHLPALTANPRARVVAVASRSSESASHAARTFGVPSWYTDHRQLLENREVGGVDMCTPNGLHAEIAIAAAQAGKHIICIKPLATGLAQADAMLDAARRAHVQLFYAENNLFIPALQRAKEVIDEGALGKVFRVRASEGIPGPHAAWFHDQAAAGGGCVLDLAVHSLAFPPYMAVAAASRIYAALDTFLPQAPADSTSPLPIPLSPSRLAQT